jgi:ABC-type antimicrobial peptide transport system permease subunit
MEVMTRNAQSVMGQLVEKLGFFQYGVEMPILDMMVDLNLANVMLSCVFNVVLIMMAGISILLIYSLLMVSVDQKNLDIGIMRMVGVSKGGCTVFVLIQAASFVFPALIMGFIVACVGNYFMF